MLKTIAVLVSVLLAASSCSSDGQDSADPAVTTEAQSAVTETNGESTDSGDESGGGVTSLPATSSSSEVAGAEVADQAIAANYVVEGEADPGYERIESRDGVLSFVVPQSWALRTDQRTSVHLNADIIDVPIDLGGGASFLSALPDRGETAQAGVWIAAVNALAPLDNELLDAGLTSRALALSGCESDAITDYETSEYVGRFLGLSNCGESGYSVTLVTARLRADERILIFIEAALVEVPDFLDFSVLLGDIQLDPDSLR